LGNTEKVYIWPIPHASLFSVCSCLRFIRTRLTNTGVYLTDLTFIEDGIPSIIKKSALINFAKRAKTAEVIRDIQQYQNVPYPLQAVPELQEYIISNMQAAGDVHEMYEKSLAVEPREREDEKIVRYVPLQSITQYGGFSLAM
jgi:son of sevenless